MAETLKRMYFGQPTTSNATLYTAPSGTGATAVIRSIHVANTSGSSATVSLGLNGTAATAANQFVGAFSVPANGLFVENINIVLDDGDTIEGLQGTNGALTVIISGVEL